MGNFSEEVLAKEPIKNEDLASSGHWFTGQAAIDKVEELEGPLTPAQKRVISLEGFVDAPYLDSKGVWTIGAGQTDKFKNKTFKETFLNHELKLVKKIPKLAKLPEALQAELMQSAYRGGILGSRKTLNLINAGDLQGAAEEFLDHDEFLDADTPDGIVNRMMSVSKALWTAGDVGGEVEESIQRQLKEQNVAPAAPERLSEGLTEDEAAELEWLQNDLALRAQAEEITETTGLTPEEEAELAWLEADLGKVHKGPAFEEPTEKTEQDFIEEIF